MTIMRPRWRGARRQRPTRTKRPSSAEYPDSMRPARFIRELMATVVCLLALAVVAEAQPPRAPLPLEPEGDRGEAVFPALEGWYRNADGSYTILLGYFNRNAGPVDIPVGPDNQIQPGGPDLGQPSHFHSRRNWGVFAVTVPADFGDQRLTWTLVANNQRSEVSFWLNPPYYLDPFLNRANGNEPPMLKVTASGDEWQGPPRGIATTHVATVGEPLVLTAWAKRQAARGATAAAAQSRRRAARAPATERHVAQVPRARRGDVRRGDTRVCEPRWRRVDDLGNLQPARRIPADGDRQRHFGERRRRRPVLLDDRARRRDRRRGALTPELGIFSLASEGRSVSPFAQRVWQEDSR